MKRIQKIKERAYRKRLTGFRAVLVFIGLFWTGIGQPLVYSQDFSTLAQRSADCILEFFSNQQNVNAAVVKFDNVSAVSGLAAQKFYQLLVSRLESIGTIGFTDLMINIQENGGVFNLNRAHGADHLIYLKLTRNRTHIGAGIAIFSKHLDKIVFIKYLEEPYLAGERDLFETVSYGFETSGFSRILESDAEPLLLDVETIRDGEGSPVYLFYYPNRVEGFSANANSFKRVFSSPLHWTQAYYPAQFPEGRLVVIEEGEKQYIAVGGNFLQGAMLLLFNGNGFERVADLDFLPVRTIELNGNRYLAGARYVAGNNYFHNRLVLVPFSGGKVRTEDELVKEVPYFYALDYSTPGDALTLSSVHLVDRDYRYIYLSDNFESQELVEEEKKGAVLSTLGNQWLVISAFTQGSDTLYFYNIQDGNRRLAYQHDIDGEVIFISGGLWKAANGFWVYTRMKEESSRPKTGTPGFKLFFWSKQEPSE